MMRQKIFYTILCLTSAFVFMPNAMSQLPSNSYIEPVKELAKENQVTNLPYQVQLKLRAISLVRIGNFAKALKTIKTLRSITPVSPEWEEFYHYVIYKLNPQNAFEELQQMSNASPSFTIDFITGKLHLLDSQVYLAIIAFNKALTKDHNNEDVLEELGNSYYKIKKYEEAISAYRMLLGKQPNHSKIKIMISKAMIKQGQYLDAIKMLDTDSDPEVISFKEKISTLNNHISTGKVTRTIAEEKIDLNSVNGSDGKMALEEKFIPTDIDIYIDPKFKISELNKHESLEIVSNKALKAPSNKIQGDVSTLELGFSVKAKKFALTGSGFTADIDYSTGAAIGVKYHHRFKDKNLKSYAELEYSKVDLKKLSGLTPDKVTLTDARVLYGVNYILENFSFGPALMYEKLTSTQTSPSTIRGNSDFFNVGLKGSFLVQVNSNLKLNIDTSYFHNLLNNSKTASVGLIDSHSILKCSSNFYYEMRPRAYIFAGVEYSKIVTQFLSSSSGRGTIGAKEIETDLSFPLGINYDF